MFKSGQSPTCQESSSNGSGGQARSQAGCFLVVSVFCWTNVLAVYVFCVLPNECFSLRMPYFAFLFPPGTLWGTVPWCLCWRTRQALVLGSETLWDKEGWTPTVQPDSCYLIGNPGDTFHCFPQQPQWKKHSKKKKKFPSSSQCFELMFVSDTVSLSFWKTGIDFFFGFSRTLLFLCLGLFLLLCQLSWRMTLLTEPWRCINLGSRDWILSLWYIPWIWIVFFRNLNGYWTK